MKSSASLRHLSRAFLATVALVACSSESASNGVTPDPSGNEPEEGNGKGDAGTSTPNDAGKDSGKADGGCTSQRWYADVDGDGFGSATTFQDSCTQPPGFVTSSTDCDDTKGSVKPGAAELCDAADTNCDGAINGTASESAACTALVGSYSGSFQIYTAEKVGTIVVNQVTCTGTITQTIDLSRNIVVMGTTTCAYSGSLGGFSKTQTGSIGGSVLLDGTFKGQLTHTFGSGMTQTFAIVGTAKDGRIDVVDSSGSWKPNPMSAVPWEVKISIGAPKS